MPSYAVFLRMFCYCGVKLNICKKLSKITNLIIIVITIVFSSLIFYRDFKSITEYLFYSSYISWITISRLYVLNDTYYFTSSIKYNLNFSIKLYHLFLKQLYFKISIKFYIFICNKIIVKYSLKLSWILE